MFSIHDTPHALCDGISRREVLRIGGLSTFGLTLPGLLQAKEQSSLVTDDPMFGRAKNVIYVWLQGGPPQHETFDPKPHAPLEIRGPFQPIQTTIPGENFCELLPRTARIAHKLAIVRSLATDNNIHSSSAYEVLTGYPYRGPNARTITPTDWPYFGSLVKKLKPSERLPALSTVWLPDIMRLNENVTPAGQTGGFLGRQWDPDRFKGDPNDPNFEIEGMNLTGIEPLRLNQRISLLKQFEQRFDTIERDRAADVYDTFQGQALDLLTSARVREAFRIQNEPDKVRDRYGRTKWGQCLLLARRMVEVGVRLVHVNWTREPGDSAVDNPMWDTHAQNADRVEDVLCPMFDVGFTALIDDLDQRGLLDETLVVAIGEFGRTPKINGSGGRDHWGPVFSFAMAGAGISEGQVYGASDKTGGYPARDRVSGGDVTATIFHLLGIDHTTRFKDTEGREHSLTGGQPIYGLMGNEPALKKPAIPGGNIARVPMYSTDLLLDKDLAGEMPLMPVTTGSRPKGWRAAPLPEGKPESAFAVRHIVNDDAHHVALGFGGKTAVTIPADATALLAQEMRNPRAGSFQMTVRACVTAANEQAYQELFASHFRCRMVMFRFADGDKNPTKRQELGTLEFQPPFSPSGAPHYGSFEFTHRLDSPAPGANFSIGRGLAIAVLLEKTSPDELKIPAGTPPISLCIDHIDLRFDSRVINGDVQV
ncbi:DUF1501 domain-containing protein [Symmachiella dynata]|uniref:DUF1501 domain-containing protein n=1 Tax=Symmachiella dynata TaxID=2527995 RepID=UPI0030EE2173